MGDEPIVKLILDTRDHDRIRPLQPGGGHEGAGHLAEFNFAGYQRFDRGACEYDFNAQSVS